MAKRIQLRCRYDGARQIISPVAIGQRGSISDIQLSSGSTQLNRNFSVLELPAYAGATVRYVGERNAGVAGSKSLVSYKLPAYSLLDLQAGVNAGKFSLALYVRNVLDKRAQLSAYTALVPLGGNALVSVVQPRTFGATVNVSF